MKVQAIIPFTGDEDLVKMTEDCIRQLLQCRVPIGVHVTIIAANDGAVRRPEVPQIDNPSFDDGGEILVGQRIGFGPAVNTAIDWSEDADAYLILNNDLQFPDREWLAELLAELELKTSVVLAPCTDVTATKVACRSGSANENSIQIEQVSAYCWLVPHRVIKTLNDRFGWSLFSPLFPNYGSDDATAAALRRVYGPRPFTLVRRSWVKHLKGQTMKRFGHKAGDSVILKQLADWKRKNKLK